MRPRRSHLHRDAKPSSQGRSSAGWDHVADWYAGHLREEDSLLRSIVYPNALRLLAPTQRGTYFDVACGDGSFAKVLAARVASVVGVDASPALIRRAQSGAPTNATFAVGDARELGSALRRSQKCVRAGTVIRRASRFTPARSGGHEALPYGETDAVRFDGATCLLAIANIDDHAAVFRGVASVLRTGAPFVLVLAHPCFRIPRQSGWGWDEQRKLQYRRIDRYLTPLEIPIQVRPGAEPHRVAMTYHRPLSAYTAALASAGFAIAVLEEWTSSRASDSGPRVRAENASRSEIPVFLTIRAERIG